MSASNTPAGSLPRYRERECLLSYISNRHRLSETQFDILACTLEDFGIAPTAYTPRVH